jgi:hypothetical protein
MYTRLPMATDRFSSALNMCPLATQIVQTKRCKCTNYNIKNECGSRAVYTFFLLYQYNIRCRGGSRISGHEWVTWVENWRDATETGWYPCTPGGQHIAGNCCEMIINTNTPPPFPKFTFKEYILQGILTTVSCQKYSRKMADVNNYFFLVRWQFFRLSTHLCLHRKNYTVNIFSRQFYYVIDLGCIKIIGTISN